MFSSSKHCVLIGLLLLSIFFDQSAEQSSACGDWESYKEDKCFKVFDKAGLQTYVEAEKFCQQQENGSSSSLISIRYSGEQDFVVNLLKAHKISNDIWIGAKYGSNNGKYKWADDSELVFSNWAQGSPKNKTDHCAQLKSDEDAFGKWSDVVCDKKNLVVCQKQQTWSLAHLQQLLMNSIKNPFPVGFIYVQLPYEKTPTDIWPWMLWNDITASYAGLFFRAEGGRSETFGKTQADNSPRLTNVTRIYDDGDENVSISPGAWSDKFLMVTGQSGNEHRSMKFFVSSGEVRPFNTAIRIWKRVG